MPNYLENCLTCIVTAASGRLILNQLSARLLTVQLKQLFGLVIQVCRCRASQPSFLADLLDWIGVGIQAA